MSEPASARPWYEDAFRAGYLLVYPHRDLAAARREVAALVARGVAGRTLDLGCGFGRHTRALCEHGVDAFGLDLSRELLSRAADDGLAGRVVRADFRRLPFGAGAFDTVLMLFSSFGYFEDGQNEHVLAEVGRVLRPGGRAVFDLMNAERVRATLVPRSTTERDGWRLLESRRLEQGGRRVVKDVELERPDGAVERWREDVRLYSPAEFGAAARRNGLAVERRAGDFDGSPLGPASPRAILWCARD